jgi:hypothetical protein
MQLTTARLAAMAALSVISLNVAPAMTAVYQALCSGGSPAPVLGSSAPLPQSLVALSPSLSDLDRDRLEKVLLRLPDSIRGRDAGNFGPRAAPEYRALAWQVAEGKALSACLSHRAAELTVRSHPGERVDRVEGWIDDAQPEMDQIRISLSTPDRRSFTFLISRFLLKKRAVFEVLNNLQGRFLQE